MIVISTFVAPYGTVLLSQKAVAEKPVVKFDIILRVLEVSLLFIAHMLSVNMRINFFF
jgi:hypothetical protein